MLPASAVLDHADLGLTDSVVGGDSDVGSGVVADSQNLLFGQFGAVVALSFAASPVAHAVVCVVLCSPDKQVVGVYAGSVVALVAYLLPFGDRAFVQFIGEAVGKSCSLDLSVASNGLPADPLPASVGLDDVSPEGFFVGYSLLEGREGRAFPLLEVVTVAQSLGLYRVVAALERAIWFHTGKSSKEGEVAFLMRSVWIAVAVGVVAAVVVAYGLVFFLT